MLLGSTRFPAVKSHDTCGLSIPSDLITCVWLNVPLSSERNSVVGLKTRVLGEWSVVVLIRPKPFLFQSHPLLNDWCLRQFWINGDVKPEDGGFGQCHRCESGPEPDRESRAVGNSETCVPLYIYSCPVSLQSSHCHNCNVSVTVTQPRYPEVSLSGFMFSLELFLFISCK